MVKVAKRFVTILVILVISSCADGETGSKVAVSQPSEIQTSPELNSELPEKMFYTLKQPLEFVMNLTTTSVGGSFGRLNKRHTCERGDMSPHIKWDGVPTNTKSLVLVLEDPASDVRGFITRGGVAVVDPVPWTHWVLYSIPPGLNEFQPGQEPGDLLGSGVIQGVNDYGKLQYNGPCPIPRVNFEKVRSNSESRSKEGDLIEALFIAEDRPYYLRLYALDLILDIPPGYDRNSLIRAIDGHVLGAGELALNYKSTKKSSCKTPDLLSCVGRFQR